MSKQEEALASAHFHAAAINGRPRYLFPFLVINAGRDIILIISAQSAERAVSGSFPLALSFTL